MKLRHLMQHLQRLHKCLCLCAGSDKSLDQMESNQVLHSWRLHKESCNLKWNQAWGKHVVFTHPNTAQVKFAHSHAFFVSLTFHVEAKA